MDLEKSYKLVRAIVDRALAREWNARINGVASKHATSLMTEISLSHTSEIKFYKNGVKLGSILFILSNKGHPIKNYSVTLRTFLTSAEKGRV